MSTLQVQKTTGGSINIGQAVIFNNVIEENGNISYDSANGIVSVLENGTYVFDWWVSTQSTSAPNVAFNLNFSGGSLFTSNSPIKTSTTSGFAIIEVTNAPITASLQNANTSNVFLSSVPVKAELRAFNIVTDTSDASECFATKQLINVLEQLMVLYPDETINIYSVEDSVGQIISLSTAEGAEMPSILVFQNGFYPRYINIEKITGLGFVTGEYNNDISFLPLPEPFIQNCNNVDVLGYYEICATLINNDLDIFANDAVINGTLIQNEYGMIVLQQRGVELPSFVVTPKIVIIIPLDS